MAQHAQADESNPIDRLPPEVVEALPPDIVDRLENGELDRIPTEALEELRPDLVDRVPDSLAEAASDNPGLAVVLVLIGIAAVLGAIWGAAKGFLKVAVVLGVVAAVAWFLFFRA